VNGFARTLGPVLGALFAAGALAGGCFGFLRATLPQMSEGQRIAARALARLDTWRSQGAVVQLGARTVGATCTAVRKGALVTYSDGTRMLVRGRRVHALRPLEATQERLLATTTAADPEFVAAEAVLGGSRSLYVAGLAVRLSVGGEPLLGRSVVDGTPAYVLRLGRGRPTVQLLVSQRTLLPLAVRYSSARLHGTAQLLAAPTGRRLAAVGGAGC
jgi:hypothetical protein